MMKLSTLILLLISTLHLFGQKFDSDLKSKNTCTGAINIFKNGDYTIQFSGKKAIDNIAQYPSLKSIESSNQIWFSYIANSAGILSFSAKTDSDFLQMVVFSQEKGDICGEISKGVAEIKRLHTSREHKAVGLDTVVNQYTMYSYRMRQGEKIQVLFTTTEGKKSELSLNWNYKEDVTTVVKSKVVDKRNDDFAPTFAIILRDLETKKPVVSTVEILNSKQVDAIYRASDLLFNIDRKVEISVLCKADGYFFDERIIEVDPFSDQETTIYLNRIASGKSIKIEDVQFKPGTSEIVESSEPKLKRLKDLLALNSNIDVEIQGHVFKQGKNTPLAQKISEARAKRIMKYLIDSGIDKKRLEAVGYGNTRPVVEDPILLSEEQSNRRVEILVK